MMTIQTAAILMFVFQSFSCLRMSRVLIQRDIVLKVFIQRLYKRFYSYHFVRF